MAQLRQGLGFGMADLQEAKAPLDELSWGVSLANALSWFRGSRAQVSEGHRPWPFGCHGSGCFWLVSYSW